MLVTSSGSDTKWKNFVCSTVARLKVNKKPKSAKREHVPSKNRCIMLKRLGNGKY